MDADRIREIDRKIKKYESIEDLLVMDIKRNEENLLICKETDDNISRIHEKKENESS
jgi:hypothetical protein